MVPLSIFQMLVSQSGFTLPLAAVALVKLAGVFIWSAVIPLPTTLVRVVLSLFQKVSVTAPVLVPISASTVLVPVTTFEAYDLLTAPVLVPISPPTVVVPFTSPAA